MPPANEGGARPGARERVLEAAYELFSRDSIASVGVDAIVQHSGVAKMSFYKHFPSKDDLILAFLDLRDTRWTTGWLEAETTRRAHTPEDRLLVMFDAFDEWFHLRDFAGCPLVRTVAEARQGTPIHAAAAHALTSARKLVKRFATEAGLADAEAFAKTWHALLKGSILSAVEGDRAVAKQVRRGAKLILDGWPRGQAA
jgi:AcrR family transcriptional regulator